MEKLFELIEHLTHTVPLLNAEPLCTFPPDNVEPHVVSTWLKQHLEEQELIAYHENSDMLDSIPYIKTLDTLALEEDYNTDFIFELYESLDWSDSSAVIPFDLPFVHYLNFQLLPHNLRLLVVPHTDHWHMLCVRNNEGDIEKLANLFAHFDIPIISPPPLGMYQAMEYIEELARN